MYIDGKFKDVYDLQLTMTLHKAIRVPVKCAKIFLQAIHCRSSYWIVASTILSQLIVIVHDSLYDWIDDNATKILRHLFGLKVQVVINNKEKQNGVMDCGLLAL